MRLVSQISYVDMWTEETLEIYLREYFLNHRAKIKAAHNFWPTFTTAFLNRINIVYLHILEIISNKIIYN
jgi:hypothetical protein